MTEQSVRLKAHLDLYQCALAMSPNESHSVSLKELKESWEQLKGRGFSVHGVTQKVVWQKTVKAAIQDLSVPFQESQYESLMRMIVPYGGSEAEEVFQVSDPLLRTVEMKMDGKISIFTKSLLGDVIVPRVLQGEAVEKYVHEVANFLVRRLRKDLQGELPDPVVKCLRLLLDVLKGIQRCSLRTTAFRCLTSVEIFCSATDVFKNWGGHL